ncbi:MAG TPA: hypothetical protein PK002_01585 [Cellvibrio sp.]|nr:hypothetical protein [Cellvibrio sp.]
MLRSFLLSIACFVAGYIASLLVHVNSAPNATDLNQTPTQQTESQTALIQSNNDLFSTNSSIPATTNKSSTAEKILAVTQFKPAKTAYEAYQQLFLLNGLSEDELKEALAATSPDKKQQRANIVWMLATRIPEHALALAEDLARKGEGELARTAISSLAQVKPKEAWAWVKGNDALLENMIPNVGQRYDFKIGMLYELVRDPASKWDVYEEAQTLIANGPKKADKYMLQGIARGAAESDPEEAINRALAGINGKKDEHLLTGALDVLIQKNNTRAKEIIQLNPELVDIGQIAKVSENLVKDNRFSEAYDFVASFKDSKQRQPAQVQLATTLIGSGQDKVIEYVNTIKSEDDKLAMIGSVAVYMGVNGVPILDKIKLMDETLSSVSPAKKIFQYAYNLKDLRISNPSEYSNYIAGLRSRDQSFADDVDKSVASMANIK